MISIRSLVARAIMTASQHPGPTVSSPPVPNFSPSPLLREGIAHCETVRDFVTRDLFSEILEGEEDHVDFIETQLDLITKIGIENYIQLQSGHAG